MRSRQGAQRRCNGCACERILYLIMCGEPSRASGKGCRPRKFLRGQADKSSWTMVPCPLWVSKADMCGATSDVHFTPESRHVRATTDFRYGPIADAAACHSRPGDGDAPRSKVHQSRASKPLIWKGRRCPLLGHSRTCRHVSAMAALPPKAVSASCRVARIRRCSHESLREASDAPAKSFFDLADDQMASVIQNLDAMNTSAGSPGDNPGLEER